jgi:adenosine deaminase
MRDYHLHMRMLDYLHSIYPKVRMTLHAGELSPGMVPPEGLKFHIREAVELGHAERIGHGVDVMYEDRPHELLQELTAKHIMVEINLTSNDLILGIKGKDNPLALYRAAHVPLALSTDDEGVSRIDITHEYEKAVEEQGLGYLDLKNMARTSLEHSFIPGESLWAAPDNFTRRKAACAGPITPQSKPASACAALLKSSDCPAMGT